MKKINLAYPSSNGTDHIVGTAWYPDNNPVAILQISHGTAEHIERYEEFALYLNTFNILVVGNDHLGHGRTARSNEFFGYISETDADQHLVDDVKLLHDYFSEKHPNLPYFILGHSLGSLIVRTYLQKYGEEHLNGVILTGTTGPDIRTTAGLKVAQSFNKRHPQKRNHFLNRIIFESYNKHFSENRTDFDWLTRDTDAVDRFVTQHDTGFVLTNNGFVALLSLQQQATTSTWTTAIPKELSILIISGEADPVGNHGKGPAKTFKQLERAGLNDVSFISHAHMRHEVLFELDRDQVFTQVSSWLLNHIP